MTARRCTSVRCDGQRRACVSSHPFDGLAALRVWQPSVTTGCVSCVSGDGIDGGPVWWTDPYTAWAAKKKLDKKQKRKAETSLDAETEARLKALRGGAGGGSGGADGPAPAAGSAGGASGSGISLDPDVEARLAALRGDGASSAGGRKEESYTTKGCACPSAPGSARTPCASQAPSAPSRAENSVRLAHRRLGLSTGCKRRTGRRAVVCAWFDSCELSVATATRWVCCVRVWLLLGSSVQPGPGCSLHCVPRRCRLGVARVVCVVMLEVSLSGVPAAIPVGGAGGASDSLCGQ
jgi:hypothetical protein